MNANANFPIIPEDAKCKNQSCTKLIIVSHGYLHKPKRGVNDDKDQDLFCNMQCYLEQERRERHAIVVKNHSSIRYFEHSQ